MGFLSANGRYFFLRVEQSQEQVVAKTIALPICPGEGMPELPPAGIRSAVEGAALPGTQLFERATFAAEPDPSIYAYPKANIYRNLYCIPLS